MLLVVTSPAAIAPKGALDRDVIRALTAIRASGNLVGVISNHAKPTWFDESLKAAKVQFLQSARRQDGEVLRKNAAKFNVEPHDVLVLAASPEDIMMGKNGGAVLVGAPSAQDQRIHDLCIPLERATDLEAVVRLTSVWPGDWWFKTDSPAQRVRVLTDLSSKGAQAEAQAAFGRSITAVVKNGGPKLTALLTVAARSLLQDGTANLKDLMWGVFPSSNSSNDDAETLSDFTHRLRTTVSRVHFAKRGAPLFIRHKRATKRSVSSTDRRDPSEQVETLHLNPEYDAKVFGRNVILVDDCTTYGASFGVATAFLRKAGAASVTSLALGKFGNQFNHFEIALRGSPFAPVERGKYLVKSVTPTSGTTNPEAQATLRAILG